MVNLPRILVHCLAATFGISSWIAINGVWVQTPLLVHYLPEGYNISSYLVIIIQAANIGPFIHYLLTLKFSIKSLEKPSIHTILLIGCISCALLSIFWDKITEINGSKHSVVFMLLTGVLSLVDCTSSVLYLPFMAHFKYNYLVTHLMGQGLSGLLPSLVALAQGVGEYQECVKSGNSSTAYPKYSEPRFSVNTFFIILLVLIIMSWVAFILLHKLKYCRRELVDIEPRLCNRGMKGSIVISPEQSLEISAQIGSSSLVRSKLFWLTMLLQAYLSAMSNGILPSIQSYSCLPYGNLTYHLAVTLSCIANPVACSIAFFISQSLLKKAMPLCVIIGSFSSIYIIYIGIESPNPLLQNSSMGKCLIIISWIVFVFLFSFSKTAIASELRNINNGEKALFYSGIFTQIGSCIGALITFFLIQYTTLFVSYNPCA